MNATLVLDKPSDGEEIGEYNETSGKASGCLAELRSGKYDFGMNVRFYRLNHFEGKVEATYAVGRDDICFLVPRKGKAPDLSNIFRPFLGETWLTIALTLPSYVLIFYVLINGFKGLQSFQYFIFQFYAHMIQQSSSYDPKKYRQRILFIFWIWFMFILSSMYQAKMSGSLIAPKELANIQNIEELTKSNLKILSLTRYNKQIIEFFDDPKYKGVYKPLFKRLENGTNPILKEKIQTFDSSYAFANKYHINVHWRRNFTKNSEVYFHQVKQCAIPYLAVHGIKYGTPLKGRINFIIRQAQEGGIIEKWERINTVGEQKNQAKLGGDDANVAFSISNLQTVFYMYFIGIAIAIFAFICETISQNYIFLQIKNHTRKSVKKCHTKKTVH
ncbi:uncharacterized protein LOC116348886 [Contarinia nasturtii]|uniref:uncharacterized protein LOC116348886 n=1 Tax=Contarinia nasturtii TaxID=265458 RepID=UPI0012D4383D|nr:uncharacterized protein LOC116348886 [Contarinia nasturtii]